MFYSYPIDTVLSYNNMELAGRLLSGLKHILLLQRVRV